MTGSYPRVLLVGGGFNQVSGTGITLSNLFHGWPAENLAVIHNSPYGNDPSRARDFWLKMEFSVSGLPYRKEWKTRSEIRAAGEPGISCNKASAMLSRGREGLRNALEFLGVTGLVRHFPLDQELIRFVEEFSPDVCYTLLGDIPIATLFEKLLDEFSLPSVVHIMDDYPSTLYQSGVFAGIVREKMHAQLRRIFSRATICLGISDAMCDEYRARYGQEFLPFHNPVDLSVWKGDITVNRYSKKQSYTITYSGRVGVSCLSSIRDVFEVVKGWNDQQVALTFDIYVNDIHQALSDAPFLKEAHPNIHVSEAPRSAAAIAGILQRSDILLLPVDFDRESIKYIRLSMPTKVPAYMATGVPILVYGPVEVASVQYAKRQEWGYVVDEQAPDSLRKAILQLCLDKALRSALSHRAQHLAVMNYEAAVVREQFRDSFAGSVCKFQGIASDLIHESRQ